MPYYAYYYYFRIISNRVAYDSSYMMYKHILPELVECRAKRSLVEARYLVLGSRNCSCGGVLQCSAGNGLRVADGLRNYYECTRALMVHESGEHE